MHSFALFRETYRVLRLRIHFVTSKRGEKSKKRKIKICSIYPCTYLLAMRSHWHYPRPHHVEVRTQLVAQKC